MGAQMLMITCTRLPLSILSLLLKSLSLIIRSLVFWKSGLSLSFPLGHKFVNKILHVCLTLTSDTEGGFGIHNGGTLIISILPRFYKNVNALMRHSKKPASAFALAGHGFIYRISMLRR